MGLFIRHGQCSRFNLINFIRQAIFKPDCSLLEIIWQKKIINLDWKQAYINLHKRSYTTQEQLDGNDFQYLNMDSHISSNSSSCEKGCVNNYFNKYFLLVLLLSHVLLFLSFVSAVEWNPIYHTQFATLADLISNQEKNWLIPNSTSTLHWLNSLQ